MKKNKAVTYYQKVEETEQKIINICDSLYEDNFYNILIKSKTSFLNSIFSSIEEIISSMILSKNINIYKIKSNIKKRYNKDYEILNKSYKEIKNKKEGYNYLTNFVKHCSKTEDIAYHSCIGNKINKYYEIKENNEIKYIFCPECKFCYLFHCIKMVCLFCKKDYFSKVLKDNEEKNFFLANWSNYHCGSMKNSVMKCIQCKSNLYINISTNILICKNQNCNFSSKPLSILWKCAKCGKDFRSNAKVYNQTEIEMIKRAINFALLRKKRAFPKELPCCKKNTENLDFFHNDKCKGILYSGFLFDKKIVVCNICHAMNFKDKFIWRCPLCETKFHLHKLIFVRPFKARKYVIKRDNSYISKNHNKMKINFNFMSEINQEFSFSRERKGIKHKRINSISIDNSSNINSTKYKSQDKTERK